MRKAFTMSQRVVALGAAVLAKRSSDHAASAEEAQPHRRDRCARRVELTELLPLRPTSSPRQDRTPSISERQI